MMKHVFVTAKAAIKWSDDMREKQSARSSINLARNAYRSGIQERTVYL